MYRFFRPICTLVHILVWGGATGLFLGTERRVPVQQTEVAQVPGVQPQGVELTNCSCGCCEIQRRKPGEIKDPEGTTLKCGRKISGTCQKQAQCLSPDNPIMSSNTHAPFEYDSYCFVMCQPFDIKPTGACIKLSPKEINKAQTLDGNGEDLYLEPQRPIHEPPAPAVVVPPTANETECLERMKLGSTQKQMAAACTERNGREGFVTCEWNIKAKVCLYVVPCAEADPCIFRRVHHYEKQARKSMEKAQAVAKEARAKANSLR